MPDIEIEDKVWESEVILIDSLGREGTVYRLVSDLKLDPTYKDPEPLNTYCPEGEYYVRLKKSLCASLGVVEKESELFLSLYFLDTCMNDRSVTPYQWQAYRTPEHDEDMFYQPINGKNGNRTGFGIPIKELPYWKWKKIVNNRRSGINKIVFRGGYQVPARRGDGRAEMVEMQSNFMGMATASLWESVFRQATSLWSMSNAGAAFRGIDPKEITVYILPTSGDKGTGRGPNVTWTDVNDAFESLPSSLGTKYSVLENSKTVIDEGLVLVSATHLSLTTLLQPEFDSC
jgi:hypothetical protein